MSKTETSPAGGANAGVGTPPAEVGDKTQTSWAVPKLKRALNYTEKKILKMTHRELLNYIFVPKITPEMIIEILSKKFPDTPPCPERQAARIAKKRMAEITAKLGNNPEVAQFNAIMRGFQTLKIFEPKLNQLQALYLFYQTCLVKNQNQWAMKISTKRENWTTEQLEDYLFEWYADMVMDPDKIMDFNMLDEELNP